ncbi:glycosyltransferase [Agromyces sp. S2-1-8]|uniref:glycosyltransferase n=1 Tax=Agromyces sp. S2-1-8 TaxID=2897180 RepID=UPI001E4D1C6B|nr:glycosyltransferase [Agromyces sp. S2-1-8]MCD5348405.1 glycosyltransferase [Agromyces sp. S2-1-8]
MHYAENGLPLRRTRHRARRYAERIEALRRVHDELVRRADPAEVVLPELLIGTTQSERGAAHAIEQYAASGHLSPEDRARLLAVLGGLEEFTQHPRPTPIEVPTDAKRFAMERWVPIHHTRYGVTVAVDRLPSESDARRIDEALGGNLSGIMIATPATLRRHLEDAYGNQLAHNATEDFHLQHPERSSKRGLVWWQLVVPALLVLGLVGACIWDYASALYIVWFVVFLSIGVNVAFKVFTAAMTIWQKRSTRAAPRLRGESVDSSPTYTVLVPLFEEANVAERIVRNLAGLDYPQQRLQVLLILEEVDELTQTALSRANLPANFEIIVVPDGPIRTKPRACNYALSFATGEHVVVYDAEDEPDVDQLRKAVAAFRADPDGRLACVQARLHYYNARANNLTRLFALEYAFWFDTMLPGLQQARLPIPLGGTSNHFRTEALRALGGWDAYNVTEDADLGMRIGAAGMRTDVLNSTTWEEACGRVWPWIRQRTRWIKGYILTAGVYTRHPIRLFQDAGLRGVVSVFALILSTPVAFLMYPILLALPIVQLTGLVPYPPVESTLLLASYLMSAMTLLLVIGLTAYAGYKRYRGGLLLLALLSPAYWCLHAIAAWRALWQSVRAPHKWEKTPHGLT